MRRRRRAFTQERVNAQRSVVLRLSARGAAPAVDRRGLAERLVRRRAMAARGRAGASRRRVRWDAIRRSTRPRARRPALERASFISRFLLRSWSLASCTGAVFGSWGSAGDGTCRIGTSWFRGRPSSLAGSRWPPVEVEASRSPQPRADRQGRERGRAPTRKHRDRRCGAPSAHRAPQPFPASEPLASEG